MTVAVEFQGGYHKLPLLRSEAHCTVLHNNWILNQKNKNFIGKPFQETTNNIE